MGIWDRSGTVSIANGTAIVTGVGTTFLVSGRPGDLMYLGGGTKAYEVLTVDSNYQITLAENFTETTISGGAYRLAPFSYRHQLNGDVLDQLRLVLASQTDIFETSGVPSNSLGADKSIAFDPVARVYYYKTDGAYGAAVSLGGADGADTGFQVKFSTSTGMSDPGTGAIRLNNATRASVTAIAIDDLSNDTGNPDVSSYILNWDDSTSTIRGTLILRKVASPANFAIFAINGASTDNSGWTQLAVAHVASGGTFANNDILTATFVPAGDAGTPGINGVSAGPLFTLSTNTSMADPGAGTLRFNNATLASATQLAIDDTSAASGNPSVAAFINMWDDSTNPLRGVLTFTKRGAEQNFAVFSINGALTDNTTWLQVPLTYVTGGGTLLNGDTLVVQFDRTGNVGADGVSAAFEFTFSTTTTMAAPGAGALRLNNATFSSVTAIAIDDTSAEAGNPDVSAAILAWDQSTNVSHRGLLTIRKKGAKENFAQFSISGSSVDNSGWTQLTVTHVASYGVLTDSDLLLVDFCRTGNAGADGEGSVSTVNEVDPIGGNVTLTAADIEIDTLTPTGYTSAGPSIEQHLSGISAALLSAGINSNYLVNADGLFNTNPVTSAADTVAIVDHWRALTQSNAISFSVQSDVADGVPKLIRLSQANASAQRMGAAQTIEADAAKLLRGQNAMLSGKVRLSTSATVRFAMLAWTGTADAAPADPINDFTSGTYTTGNFFTSTTMSLIAEGNLAVSANVLTDISLSGAVPSATNNIIVLIWTSATAIQNVTLDFRAKLEIGNVQTGWRPFEPALELARTDDFARRLQIASAGDAELGLLTNPRFEFSQENGSTLLSSAATAAYGADEWVAFEDCDAVLSVQNIADPFSGTSGLRRLKNSVKVIATTADASFAAGQYANPFAQKIEGSFFKSLGWGTADARAIDVVFIAQCSVTGTYPVAIRNAAANRSYVTTVALTANTPTVCMVTIPGDTSGTWVATNAQAADLSIGNITGTTYHAAALNAWEAANKLSHSTGTNWAASGTTNFFQVAYCQAFPAGVLPFTAASQITGEALQILLNMHRAYDVERARCERYYYKFLGLITLGVGGGVYSDANQVQMAAAPLCLRRATMRTAGSAAFSMLGAQGTDWAVSTTGGSNQSGFTISLSSVLQALKTAHGLTAANTNLITITTSGGFLLNDRM